MAIIVRKKIRSVELEKSLGSLFVHLVIVLWRGFISVKITEWNVNKSASRPVHLRAKGGVVSPSILC